MIPFAFQPGHSVLHRLDPRYKFVIICMLSVCLVSAAAIPSLIFGLILFIFYWVCQINLFSILKQMKLFILLLGFVFLSRSLFTPGYPLLKVFGISMTIQGVSTGFLVTLKFFLVMMTGLLFCTTTRPNAVKSAVQWFLKPIPLIPEKRIAVMVSLSISFMPVILKQVHKISDAQAARCGDLTKNPVKRITRLVLPMLKKTFLSADNLILAMESRCYTEDRTDPEFTVSGHEFYFLFGSVLLSLGFFLF